MADIAGEPQLRITLDTPANLPFETVETLVAAVRSVAEISVLAAIPVLAADNDSGLDLYWVFGDLAFPAGFQRRRRRPSELTVVVSRLRYGSPLEIVAGVVGVGWVIVQAAAALATLFTTQLAQRQQLVSEANRDNAEARKLDEEARLLRLQADAIAVENAQRLEQLARDARERANESLQGVRTDIAQVLLDSADASAAEQFLRATDDAEALGRAAALAEFNVTVEVQRE